MLHIFVGVLHTNSQCHVGDCHLRLLVDNFFWIVAEPQGGDQSSIGKHPTPLRTRPFFIADFIFYIIVDGERSLAGVTVLTRVAVAKFGQPRLHFGENIVYPRHGNERSTERNLVVKTQVMEPARGRGASGPPEGR